MYAYFHTSVEHVSHYISGGLTMTYGHECTNFFEEGLTLKAFEIVDLSSKAQFCMFL